MDSREGEVRFITTDIDDFIAVYIWQEYFKTKYWMLIEEKRFNRPVKHYQKDLFELIDMCCLKEPSYKGYHVLTFENTSPGDGGMHLDGYAITTEDLLVFLRFEKPDTWYLFDTLGLLEREV